MLNQIHESTYESLQAKPRKKEVEESWRIAIPSLVSRSMGEISPQSGTNDCNGKY
jgi:hypothetical protein